MLLSSMPAREIEENIIKNGASEQDISVELEVLIFQGRWLQLLLFHSCPNALTLMDRHLAIPDPPPFCMLARKHWLMVCCFLNSSLERVLYLHFSVLNARGQRVQKTWLGNNGRHSNLVLLTPRMKKINRSFWGLETDTSVHKPLPGTFTQPPLFTSPPQKTASLCSSYEHFCQEINRLQGRPAAREAPGGTAGVQPFSDS